MRNSLLALSLVFTVHAGLAAPPSTPEWQAKVNQTMPLMGHRNWILIVDSAYPLQTSPGIDTIETGAGQLEVVRYVLEAVGNSIHVRPEIYLDAELPFVSDQDAPGAAHYRAEIGELFRAYPVQSLPHDQIIAKVADAGNQFHVLVLKTRLAIPYTSVFMRLELQILGRRCRKAAEGQDGRGVGCGRRFEQISRWNPRRRRKPVCRGGSRFDILNRFAPCGGGEIGRRTSLRC